MSPPGPAALQRPSSASHFQTSSGPPPQPQAHSSATSHRPQHSLPPPSPSHQRAPRPPIQNKTIAAASMKSSMTAPRKSASPPPCSSETRAQRRCEHASAAWSALETLGIDPRLFNHDFDKCYCPVCEPNARPRSDGKGGIPRGYTRFALHVEPNQRMARGVFSSWPKAFHGTKHDRVKSICDLGYLLIPGATTPSGLKIGVRDGHIAKALHRDVDPDDIRDGRRGRITRIRVCHSKIQEEFSPHECAFLSPHHGYAECPVYAEHKKISTSVWSSLVGSTRNVVFILEFRVQPTTFDEGSHTVSASCLAEIYTDEFSPPDDSWEWFTDRFGVMQLTGVLVRVDGVKSEGPSSPSPWTDVPIAHLMPSPHTHLLALLQRCSVARRRFELVRYLGLPDCLFDFSEQSLVCYCGQTSGCHCFSPSSRTIFTRAGHSYRLPVGYTGFGLHVNAPKFETNKVWETWPVAYHGTTIHAVKGILRTGMLLPTGFTGPDGKKVGGRDEKSRRDGRVASSDDDSRGKIFFSPLVDYASHPVHSTPDVVQLRGCRVRVSIVLQLRVAPSFSKHASTIDGFHPHESQMEYSGQEEWFTERFGCVEIYRILIKDEVLS